MNLRLASSLALTVLAACSTPRVVVVPPDSGTPGVCSPQECGAPVRVSTSLAPGTALTADECATICASVWCGNKPIGNPPNCLLADATTVQSGATVYDCGYCFGECAIGPGACGDGCCDPGSGCCRATSALYCRGLSCFDCPAPDPRCSLDGCRTFESCGTQLAAEPRAAACADADGGVDPNVELAAYCPDACNAMDAGAVLQAGCSDAGTTDAGTPDAGACVDACRSTRTSCDQACPRSSFRACMDCSARCGIDLAHCLSGCG
jgi:hypothetical protein